MNARAFLHWVAIGFGAGRLRPAPGTWGTLVAVPIAVFLSTFGPFVYMAACLLILTLAIVACEIHERDFGGHDASEVVIDEVIGYLIAVTWLPFTWQTFVFGFALFRLFDIWKPLFIGIMDKRMKGGVGTVVDDVAAGIVANVILQVIYHRTTWLGVQWTGVWS